MRSLAVVASLSGVLFGYDASSINDALPLLSDHFGLSDSMEGVVVSVLLLGAVFGALLAGVPADTIGRRLTIIISGILFIVGCVLASFLARNVGLLIAGRIIIGMAIGVTSAVTPMFIAEMAPAKHRGGLVMGYQLRCGTATRTLRCMRLTRAPRRVRCEASPPASSSRSASATRCTTPATGAS